MGSGVHLERFWNKEFFSVNRMLGGIAGFAYFISGHEQIQLSESTIVVFSLLLNDLSIRRNLSSLQPVVCHVAFEKRLFVHDHTAN